MRAASGGHRLAEDIALRIFAAELVELDRVRIRLGALRHHVHAEIVRERDDRAQDHRPRALVVGAHERLIDLDGVERKALKVGERRMAGAEIVERQPGAELADARQHLRGVLGVLHHQRLGQLELERAAGEPGARQHGAQIVDQIVAQQLARRHVDAGEHRLAQRGRCAASRELARGALQHEQAEIDDQPDLLGDADELRRRHPAHLRMIPARQRLEAGDRAILQAHDRLVEDGDLLALERAAQLGFQRQPVGLARPHRRLEQLDAVAADALGVIHRKLGVLEHLFGAAAAGRRRAQARSRR